MFTYHPAADDELPIFSTGMIGQYAHGNEPSHHVIYLFNAIGHENRTQEYVAKVSSTRTSLPVFVATKIADRCQHGMYSVRWDSTPSIPSVENMR